MYDGDNIVEELNGTGAVQERYTYGPGTDEPLVGQRQPKIFFYEADGLGSVTSLTDPTGALAATYTYDSFGFLTNSTGSATNWFRYTGRQFDSDTALYYYRARYYDAMSGRFLSEDPTEFTGGFNFYAYTANNPLRYKDPSGMGLTSVDAAMEQAIARGNVGEVEALLQTTGDELTPAMRQAAQTAIDNSSTTEGGAKSAAELAQHLKNAADAQDYLAELEQELEEAPTKAKQAIQDEIDELKDDIDGRWKEIKQKWDLCRKALFGK